ncbi:estradiol 17-beta-dehydrogenase 2 [Hylaeus anthracinus]|uniref:estradiol 17-beta-dehydrogenase 2 n=1 Tax=Hylaeus anthracinus TaxID=313031 RepID=UPI0023B9B569|nr:estradiol 17-beta-dehydrogenase 2 [Hylaeus anthracinus]
MELMKSITRRYSTILAIDVTSSIGLAYAWNRGHKYLASTISLCCIGGTYLYRRTMSRDRISTNHAIVVTGCDSGLGYSLALHCRQLGATVIAGVLQNDGQGAKNLKENDVHVYPLDVTKTNSVVNFVDFVRAVLTQDKLVLRCLINNAAVMIFGEFEWQTEDQIRYQVEVNFLGAMRLTRELMPMIRAHSSRIIIISSHCNIQPIPGVAAYSGTKAAITAWATAIRVELKKYGVKVVCFVPGSFVTESNILARQAEHFETMRNSMADEAKVFYADYFARYSEYFGSVAPRGELKKLQGQRMYEVFEDALLDKHPSAIYKHESWRYCIYHTLFLATPTRVRDWLVQKFVQGPSWTKKAVQTPNGKET